VSAPAPQARGPLTEEAPPGLVYQPDFVSVAEEKTLVEGIGALEFAVIEMRGRVARRRAAHFGWQYGYATWRIEPGAPLPGFLFSLRARAAALAGVEPEALAEVLVTEYPPDAGIGWHRDAPQFGDVLGVSLLAPCRLRFRRGRGREAPTWDMTLAPRSAYLLRGAARWTWQHSIPAVKRLRYSVTFRTLRSAGERRPEKRGR
jgi:alkylated DNA repair dioxygenase AlkB